MRRSNKPSLSILFLTSNLAWRGGGTFYRALGFAKALVARGHEVTLLATAEKERWQFQEETVEGVTVVSTPALLGGKLRSGWDFYEVWRRKRWLRESYDIVHGFEARPVVIYPAKEVAKRGGALFLDWCDWLGTGGLIEERPFLPQLLLRRVEDYYETSFRSEAIGNTVINFILRDKAAELSIPDDEIHWLPNGSEPDKVPQMDKQAARHALGLDPDASYVGHLGHALPNDGRLMAQAFAQIRHDLPDSRLLIIGDYRKNILGYVEDAETAVHTGYVQGLTLNQYLAACDVLWLPLQDTITNRGRWPMKLSDYMTSSRPVVGTAVGDLKTVFGGRHPIGLVAEATADDFAVKTLQLLNRPSLGKQLGKNGRYLAETTFNLHNIVAELENFYYQRLT